jgi:hypothetical protein
MAHAAEPRHVDVGDSLRRKQALQRFAIELRIMARLRNRPDVYQLLNTMRLEDREELFGRVRGVSDGEDHLRTFSARSTSAPT